MGATLSKPLAPILAARLLIPIKLPKYGEIYLRTAKVDFCPILLSSVVKLQ